MTEDKRKPLSIATGARTFLSVPGMVYGTCLFEDPFAFAGTDRNVRAPMKCDFTHKLCNYFHSLSKNHLQCNPGYKFPLQTQLTEKTDLPSNARSARISGFPPQ